MWEGIRNRSISRSEEIKKDCVVIPIMFVAEVEKWREPGKGEVWGIIPVRLFYGNSNVISLHTPNPRYHRKIRGFGVCLTVRPRH